MSVDKMYIILAITIIIIFLEIIYLVFVMVNRSYQNNSIIFKSYNRIFKYYICLIKIKIN